MTMPEHIVVGEITAPHGHKGEVRVVPLTDYPDRFFDLDYAYVGKAGDVDRIVIESVRKHKRFYLITFKDVDSIDDAEQLRGCQVFVDRQQLVALPEGHYFTFQIVGLSVFDTDGNKLGQVCQVLKTGNNDVYVVKPEPSVASKDILIPAIRDVVKEIDIEASHMVVKLMPGLMQESSNGN